MHVVFQPVWGREMPHTERKKQSDLRDYDTGRGEANSSSIILDFGYDSS